MKKESGFNEERRGTELYPALGSFFSPAIAMTDQLSKNQPYRAGRELQNQFTTHMEVKN
ncbi:MAG: hypothetical protein ABEK16_02895 [Candidatus Nanohalobium sp.]